MKLYSCESTFLVFFIICLQLMSLMTSDDITGDNLEGGQHRLCIGDVTVEFSVFCQFLCIFDHPIILEI